MSRPDCRALPHAAGAIPIGRRQVLGPEKSVEARRLLVCWMVECLSNINLDLTAVRFQPHKRRGLKHPSWVASSSGLLVHCARNTLTTTWTRLCEIGAWKHGPVRQAGWVAICRCFGLNVICMPVTALQNRCCGPSLPKYKRRWE